MYQPFPAFPCFLLLKVVPLESDPILKKFAQHAFFIFALWLALGTDARAASCFAVANANWNVATTWSVTSGGTAGNCTGTNGAVANTPGSADTANIGETTTARTVTIPTGYAAAASAVVLGTTAGSSSATALTLAASTSSLTVGAGLTVNKPGNANTKALNVNAGTVSVGGNVTLGGTTTTATRIANITITTGTLNITGNLVFTVGVNANNVLTMSGGAGTVNLAGAFTTNNVGTLSAGTTSIFNYNGSAAAQTIPIGVAAIVYNHLHVNNTNAGGATLSAEISATNVTGNVRVQSGILNDGGFAMVGGDGDTFQVADGATFRMTGTAVFPTGFATFTFGPTGTVRYLQTNAQTVSARTYGHLEVSPSANTITHTFAAGTTTVAGNLTLGNGTNTAVVVTAATNSTTLDVNGNVSISANTTLVAHASNPFTVGGNWTRTGTFTQGIGTVTFDGAAAQAINGATTFNNLIVANTSGGVSLGASHTVSGTLTLTSGVVTTGANTLITTANCPGSVSRTAGYVAGALSLRFPTGAPNCTFHVGDSTTYRPANLYFDSVNPAGSITGSVSQTAGDHAQIATSSLNSAQSVNRLWTLSKDVSIAFTVFGAIFSFVSGDVDAGANTANFIVQRYAAPTWSRTTLVTPLAASTEAANISGMGDFAIGQPFNLSFSREKEFVFTRELY